MRHTVLRKSAWANASWHVAETFDTKKAAQNYIAENQEKHLRSNTYYMTIKAHRKSLIELTPDIDMLGGNAKFNDGTRAIYTTVQGEQP